MESLRHAEVMVKDTAGVLTGNIVIASVYDIKQYYLPLLADFAKTYKEVNLTILTGDNTENPFAPDIRTGGFRHGQDQSAHRAVCRSPFNLTPALFDPSRRPFFASEEKISLADLRQCRFVFLPRKTTSRRIIEEKFYRAGYMLNVSFEAWSLRGHY